MRDASQESNDATQADDPRRCPYGTVKLLTRGGTERSAVILWKHLPLVRDALNHRGPQSVDQRVIEGTREFTCIYEWQSCWCSMRLSYLAPARWSVTLAVSLVWSTCHNSKHDQRIEERHTGHDNRVGRLIPANRAHAGGEVDDDVRQSCVSPQFRMSLTGPGAERKHPRSCHAITTLWALGSAELDASGRKMHDRGICIDQK